MIWRFTPIRTCNGHRIALCAELTKAAGTTSTVRVHPQQSTELIMKLLAYLAIYIFAQEQTIRKIGQLASSIQVHMYTNAHILPMLEVRPNVKIRFNHCLKLLKLCVISQMNPKLVILFIIPLYFVLFPLCALSMYPWLCS